MLGCSLTKAALSTCKIYSCLIHENSLPDISFGCSCVIPLSPQTLIEVFAIFEGILWVSIHPYGFKAEQHISCVELQASPLEHLEVECRKAYVKMLTSSPNMSGKIGILSKAHLWKHKLHSLSTKFARVRPTLWVVLKFYSAFLLEQKQ